MISPSIFWFNSFQTFHFLHHQGGGVDGWGGGVKRQKIARNDKKYCPHLRNSTLYD